MRPVMSQTSFAGCCLTFIFSYYASADIKAGGKIGRSMRRGVLGLKKRLMVGAQLLAELDPPPVGSAIRKALK